MRSDKSENSEYRGRRPAGHSGRVLFHPPCGYLVNSGDTSEMQPRPTQRNALPANLLAAGLGLR